MSRQSAPHYDGKFRAGLRACAPNAKVQPLFLCRSANIVCVYRDPWGLSAGHMTLILLDGALIVLGGQGFADKTNFRLGDD